MSNLLRSEFYRLFRSKSFYICAVIAIILNSLGLLVNYLMVKAMPEQEELYASLMPKDGLSYAIKAFSDGNAQLLISIIVAIFIVAEFSHGTMKNVVSKGFSKISIYVSKLTVTLVATYLTIIVTMIGAAVTATVITGTFGDFTGETVANLLKTFGIELLLNAGFVALLVLVAMTVRNLGGVIAINIIGILTIAPILTALLQYLVKNKIEFTKYDLFINIASFANSFGEAAGMDYLRAALVGLGFIIVTTALGIYAFIKSDIK